MKKLIAFGFSVAAVLALAPAATDAQECWSNPGSSLDDRPSPLHSTAVNVGDGAVLVCYGAPSARGRMLVGGDAHPFGSKWRMGANEATTIHLNFAASVAGVDLEPGAYSLYAVPGEDSWEIFVNTGAERWGVPINDAVTANDVGSGMVSVSDHEHTETMNFSFEDVTADSAMLVLRWEGYRVDIPVMRR